MKICENVYWYREKGWMDANTFVIKGDVTVLIDPGLSEYAWMKCEEMREDGIEPQEIDILLITHSHPDHCDALSVLKKHTNARIGLHSSQAEWASLLSEASFHFLGVKPRDFKADFLVEALKAGREERSSQGERNWLEVLHTPGHTPDSVCFYLPENAVLLTGDTVFERGIGRTDLPFGDEDALKASIERISALDVEILLPGHGNIIKGRENVRKNFAFVMNFFR